MDEDDPRLLLARRLRALREARWPGVKITQQDLARALGGQRGPLSVPLISSWESHVNPKIPPPGRLDAYAVLFATPRSFAGTQPCLFSPKDMSEQERKDMNELRRELADLRGRAMVAGHQAGAPTAEGAPAAAAFEASSGSLSRGPWYFPDGATVTIVCSQWPPEMLERIPYTDPNDPDYIELLTYSELDSLFMSYGHVRAANPASQVDYFRSGLLPADNYSTHLVCLGGSDWNVVTSSLLKRLALPVRQIADWSTDDGQLFAVDEGAGEYRPVLEEVDGRKVLREDVALFARTVSPYNQERIATICSGMYGRGTYGIVRALTDPAFRDRNTRYLESRFDGCLTYCLLSRVSVENNRTLTPDWTIDGTRLFEWSGSVDEE